MICELSDGEAAVPCQVPKYIKLAMFEGKYGFLIEPVCIINGLKVEINRIRIPKKDRTILERVFGGQETWQVQVWEYAEGYNCKTPTWLATFDPETTREEATKEAERVRQSYRNWEEGDRMLQAWRPAEPRISLPPQKPLLDIAKENPQAAVELTRRYAILREERSARFKVLRTILPKTVELAEKAEQIADDESRQQLELESLEAYYAENAPGWPVIVFKAWQHLNQIGPKWFDWLYLWKSKQMKKRKEINVVDYELAFNWRWKKYYLLTAAELKEEVFKETGQQLSAEAIQKRRERLGLATQRPTGPPPKEP